MENDKARQTRKDSGKDLPHLNENRENQGLLSVSA
jgi:hypothetical protein